jgi:alkylhydroperoxidase family enzyme
MFELLNYERSDKFTAREKIALRYADAIMYDPNQAGDALWAQLKDEFSEAEIVEIGYWIGFTFGGQRWLKTLSARQGEFDEFLRQRRGRESQAVSGKPE